MDYVYHLILKEIPDHVYVLG